MPDEVESLHRLFQIYYGVFISANIKTLENLIAKLHAEERAGAAPQDRIWRSVLKRDLVKTSGILAECNCANIRDAASGCTPLHICTDPNIARLLLRYGAHPNAPDNYGETPLHHVCARLDLPTAQSLLAGGASPLLKDHFGRVPADCILMTKGDPKLKSTLSNILKIAESRFMGEEKEFADRYMKPQTPALPEEQRRITKGGKT